MRFIAIVVTMAFLFPVNSFAEGLTSGNLNGKHEDARQPLVEELQKAKFGDKKKARDEKRRNKKAKRG